MPAANTPPGGGPAARPGRGPLNGVARSGPRRFRPRWDLAAKSVVALVAGLVALVATVGAALTELVSRIEINRQLLLWTLVIGGVLVFLSLVALGSIVLDSVLLPLKELAGAAERLARGQRAVLPGTKRDDVVGRLARALQRWEVGEGLRKALIEHAPIGVCHVSLKGNIVTSNPEMARLFGYGQFEKVSLTDVTDTQYMEATRKLYGEVAEGTRERFTLEKLYKRKDGSSFWGEVTVAGVRDNEGKVLSFISMVTDVSDRKEKMARAAAIQQGLLPKVVPMLRGYDLAGQCVTAEEVGGDFFDWYPSGPGQLTLTLGDVMGKGISAAILMATVRTALRAGSRLPDPADAVRLAAEAMTDVEESHTFVTLLHARLDESTGEIRMIDAGHGFVFVLKASGELIQFPRHDLPLGVFPQQEYRETRVTLGPGDIFLTFSDGVLDLHPDVEQNFEDLTRLLAGSVDAGEVIERLSTSRDAEGPAAGDDVTVVALRRSGDAQTSGISLTQRKKQRRAAPARS